MDAAWMVDQVVRAMVAPVVAVVPILVGYALVRAIR